MLEIATILLKLVQVVATFVVTLVHFLPNCVARYSTQYINTYLTSFERKYFVKLLCRIIDCV